MAERNPYFPFYGKDAYDDEVFSSLSFAAQGLYIFLAWWQWQEGSIPADLDSILDRVGRRRVRETRKMWPLVNRMYPEIEGGTRRQNAKIEDHRARLVARRATQEKWKTRTDAGFPSKKPLYRDTFKDTEERVSEVLTTDSLSLETATAIGSCVDLEPKSKSETGEGSGEGPNLDGLGALDLVHAVVAVVAPSVVPDDFAVSLWLRDINSDPWWISAAICGAASGDGEAAARLRSVRSSVYLRKILLERAEEGWTMDGSERQYTEHALASFSRQAVGEVAQ